MKKLFAYLPLLLLCSCVSTQKTPPPPAPPEPDINPYHVALKGAVPNLVIAPEPKFCTNVLHWQWSTPDEPGLLSYSLYHGTNSGNYFKPIQLVGLDTNYFMTNIDEIISTNPFVKITMYPDGSVTTNCQRMFVVMTATYDVATLLADFGTITDLDPSITNGVVESGYSLEAVWPPYPAPPWSALVFSWTPVTNAITPNSVVPVNTNRNVTLLSSTTLGTSANWINFTNVTGTGFMIPIPTGSLYFRGITTDLPPVMLHMNGGYINGTN